MWEGSSSRRRDRKKSNVLLFKEEIIDRVRSFQPNVQRVCRIPPAVQDMAQKPVELNRDLSSRELIYSTERASDVPLHPLVDLRTRTNAQQGAWLALQRAENSPRDLSLDHLSGSLQRDVERQERHVAEETMF